MLSVTEDPVFDCALFTDDVANEIRNKGIWMAAQMIHARDIR